MPSITEKCDEKGREIMDFAKQKTERLQSATNECADNARELVKEHLEEQTTAENLKQYIGEKFEGLKEGIQHGGHKVYEVCTGHGLMGPDENKPESFKQQIGEKFEGLKEGIQHGGHKVHEVCTDHGLMEPDKNTPESFKQQIGEKFEGLKEKLVGKTTTDSAAD